MTLLLVLGCTWVLVDEPCDTSVPAVEVDGLRRSSASNWQLPALGGEFSCGIQRTEGEVATEAGDPASIACFGDGLLAPDSGLLLVESVAELTASPSGVCVRAGGGEFDCFGDGTAELVSAMRDVSQQRENVHRIAVAEQHLCALFGESGGGQPSPDLYDAFCVGEGAASEIDEAAGNGRLSGIEVAEGLTCGIPQSGRIDCWGPAEDWIRDPDFRDNTDWGAYAVGQGVMCAVGAPGNVRTIECWGLEDHPVVMGVAAVREALDARAVRAVNVDIGADFACAYMDRFPQDGGDSIICWGDNTFGQLEHPRGPQLGRPALAAGGHHACAIEAEEDSEPPASGGAPVADPAMGRLVCWGDNVGGQSSPP